MTLNKKTVAIVTDGAASLTPEMGLKYGVRVVPIYVMFGTTVYRDGVDLDANKFYDLLRNSAQSPTTSQPTVADFVQVYTELSEQADAIVSVHPSIQLSATVNSARAAKKEFPDLPIHVIDSKSIAHGLGLMAIMAARAAEAGQDADAVVQLINDLIPKMNIIFTVDTLEFLRRGGRIGGAAALLGSMMKVKPVMHLEKGRIEPLEKPRTRKRALNRVLTLMEERVSDKPVRVVILHCQAAEDAQVFAERVQERFECVELMAAEAGPVIGTHAGPGTLGVVFSTE
jgi:DegV family protein with EDD domain